MTTTGEMLNTDRKTKRERYQTLLAIEDPSRAEVEEMAQLCLFLTGDSRLVEPHRVAWQCHQKFLENIKAGEVKIAEHIDVDAQVSQVQEDRKAAIEKLEQEFEAKIRPLIQRRGHLSGAYNTTANYETLRDNLEDIFGQIFHDENAIDAKVAIEKWRAHIRPEILNALIESGVVTRTIDRAGRHHYTVT